MPEADGDQAGHAMSGSEMMPTTIRATQIAGLAILLTACEQPLATSPRPEASPHSDVRSNVAVAAATLDQLLAAERSSAGNQLLPEKLALTAQLAAMLSAPAGSPEARTLDEILTRLRTLEAARSGSGQR